MRIESDQKGLMIYCVESDQKGPLINALNLTEKGLQILLCIESDQKRASDLYMRWIWLKRASKYLCIESDQKGPLIYALNLTEKGLQIFMCRIWPKRASDLSVESDWKRPQNIIMRRIWQNRASDLCVESDWKGPPNIYA